MLPGLDFKRLAQSSQRTQRPLFERVLSVDLPLCPNIELRRAAINRLPIDSLIAATAAAHNAVLVYRDPHFSSIPGHLLKQEILPEK